MRRFRDAPPKAVLLDSLGTLLRMKPPAPLLCAQLAGLGFEISLEEAEAAISAEISYYLEHHTEGRDSSSLAELRNRCAGVVHDELGLPALSMEATRAALLASLRFEAYPDAAPALRELRDRGLRLVVASNWDSSLREVLARAGIDQLIDDVVTSAEVGARKPAAAVFEAALQAAGSTPAEAVHVGDSLENDIGGAHTAGVRAVLLRRSSDSPAPSGIPVISSLAELPALLLSPE